MNLEKTIASNSSFIAEAIIMIIIAGTLIGLFTFVDIITHDFYSLPIGSMCYEGNNIPECKPIQELHGCPDGGDACIQQKYYQMIQVEMFTIAGLLVFIKLSMAKIVKRKINGVRIISALIFGSLPIILLWTGFEDYLYYATRNMPIPSTLPWLDDVGLFPIVNQNVLHITNTISLSLYIVMAIGFVAIMSLLYINAKIMKNAGYVTAI